MFIRDLEGNEYFLEGVIKHEQELNGDERIDMDIEYTERNAEFLSKKEDLSMWIIIFKDKEYRIISSNQSGYGVKYKVSVTGILYVLDWLNTHRVEERIDASLTVKEAFDLVFNDSPFTYIIVTPAYSHRFEGLGEGEVKLEMFKTFIERFEYEFKIVDKVIYLYSQVGNDTNFEYRYKVNASNISKEVDASEMWTYVRGYGDYREDSVSDEDETSVATADDSNEEIDPTKEAKLRPGTMKGNPYVSPLAEIIGIREGPSVRNANITKPETLMQKMKQVIQESIKISFSADIYDMSQVGYDYQHAELGDRVFLVDERIGLDQEIRVVKIDEEVNHLGDILKIEITFGTSNLSDTYSSNINTAIKDIEALKEGRTTLPFPTLDIRAQSMVKVLENTNSELTFDSNGVHAVDKSNKNNLVTLNSSGLMLSTDGGRTAKTALTAEGIVADAITTGSLDTQLVTIVGRENFFYMDGDMLLAKDPNSLQQTVLDPQGLKITRPDGAIYIENGIPRHSLVVQKNPLYYDNVTFDGINYRTSETEFQNFEYFYAEHNGRYLTVNFAAGLAWDSTGTKNNVTILLQEFGENSLNNSIEKKLLVEKGDNQTFDALTIDLGPPTYRIMRYYLKFKKGPTNAGNIATIRTTRIYTWG